ncbi:MAG: hypothetical protein WKG00_15730 [Polyangiaceae bacterium]
MSEVCPEGLEDCAEYCSNTQIDPFNCGACGNECAEGDYCSDGGCGAQCDDPQLERCGGTCTDTGADPDNCGECGNVCTLDEECFAGDCRCLGGGQLCGGACCTGSCIGEVCQ